MVRRIDESPVLERDDQSAKPGPSEPGLCGEMVGGSAPMRALYDLIRRIADHDALAEHDISRNAQPPSVLITGESGTGKELVARAIHSLGSRAKRPFVVVPCGAIPENLIEAELFGYEKGAFPHANVAHEGYFEKAGDGTLLLDEIGELGINMQPKLLRALQQREFSRLGSNNLTPLPARILFATHRNLAQMVTAGTFRQDLFYRINVVKVRLPPLRERPKDVALLAGQFLARYSKMYAKAIESIEPAAMKLLETHSWPGNVRELENEIQSAIIMAEDTCIRVKDLSEDVRDRDDLDSLESEFPGSLEDKIREYRVKLVNEAIQECNGNQALAAQCLSISRAELLRLIHVPAAVQELRLA
jgi:DNA-binding NtrC family response regulator